MIDIKEEEKEEDDKMISVTSTVCAHCIFCEYDNDKFAANGQSIIPIELENGTKCFVIDGKTCVYHRPKGLTDIRYKNMDDTEILKAVKKELKIPYHVILFFRQEDTIEQLTHRLNELQNG